MTICFDCDEIRPCDSNGEFVNSSAGDRLMDAANTIAETNDLYLAKQRLIIHISGARHIERTYSTRIRCHRLCCSRFTYRKCKGLDKTKKLWGGIERFQGKNLDWASYTEAMHSFWMSCYKIGCFFVKIENFYPRLHIHRG